MNLIMIILGMPSNCAYQNGTYLVPMWNQVATGAIINCLPGLGFHTVIHLPEKLNGTFKMFSSCTNFKNIDYYSNINIKEKGILFS